MAYLGVFPVYQSGNVKLTHPLDLVIVGVNPKIKLYPLSPTTLVTASTTPVEIVPLTKG